jgi:hypothetical protein
MARAKSGYVSGDPVPANVTNDNLKVAWRLIAIAGGYDGIRARVASRACGVTQGSTYSTG